jgi:putative heme-binding domain-containing protein
MRLFLGALLLTVALPVSAREEFSLEPGDVVMFAGGTNMVRLQRAGYFEAILTRVFAQARPKFRDLAWEADTVFLQGSAIERWRADGFGQRDQQFARIGATVVVAQFGRLESMAGQGGLPSFTKAYNQLLDGYQKQTARVVLVSPTPFERPSSPLVPNVSKHNTDLALYVKAIARIAEERNAVFVDLFTGAKPGLTDNGMHLDDTAQQQVAVELARKLGIAAPAADELEPLRLAVIEKHRLWYDYWRPANWKLLYGDDARRKFTEGGEIYIPFKEEWQRLVALIDQAEQRVWQIARGGADPGHNRPLPEVLHGDENANVLEELASFTTSDGLEVQLFASEKDGLTSPLAIRWDPAGRAYVTVTTTYPHVFPGNLPDDKIILLEDTNRDGSADRSTVFADGLNIPTGLELGDGGVYVGQNSELLFLRDTDGDGKADERRVILGGFGNGDSHQTINSFVWSPGGELYMGQGDGIESRVETPWGPSHLYRAGFYRFRPHRLQLHPLVDDAMGPGNPWGVEFDDWGQIFCIDGAGGVAYLSPGQVPTSHRQPLGVLHKADGYCGIGYLDGRHLPESMRGDFVVGHFKTNRVLRFSVHPDRSGFKLAWKEPLLQSRHRNFRPIDVKVGPDGAIYVVDWYNPVICHQNDAYRDPTRDKAHGRIWRVSSASPTIEPPNFSRAPMTTVVDGLKSTERWTRYQAKREMTARDPAQVATALGAWIKALDPEDHRHEHHLHEALGAYATIEVVEPGLLVRLLGAKDPRARAYAARVVGRWHDRLKDPLAHLAGLMVDEHPPVRMEAVLACAAVPSPQSIQVAARVVDRPMDPWLDYALTQAAHHLKLHWFDAFKRGELVFAKPAHLAAVLSRTGGRDVLESLENLAASKDLNAKARGAAIAAIVAVGGPKELSAYGLDRNRFTQSGTYDAESHADVLRGMLEAAIDRNVRPHGDPSRALILMIDHPHDGLRATALTLAGVWRIEATGPSVLAAAKDEQLPLAVRSAAFWAMAQMRLEPVGVLLDTWAGKPHALPVRGAAIEALCIVDMGSAATHAVDLFSDSAENDWNPSTVIEGFLSRKGGGEILTQALKAAEMSPALAERLLQALYTTGRSDASLGVALRERIGVSGEAPPYSEKYVKKLVADARVLGDARRGATTTAACIVCHRIGKAGSVIGPDLTSIGTILSAERITEELLWPKRHVKEGYTLLQVLTEAGEVLQGYERRAKESPETGDVVMRQLAADVLVTVRKDQVAMRTVVGSAMPSGLTAAMTRQELLDMIRYLSQLGSDAAIR